MFRKIKIYQKKSSKKIVKRIRQKNLKETKKNIKKQSNDKLTK